jgi:hypothetical protein
MTDPCSSCISGHHTKYYFSTSLKDTNLCDILPQMINVFVKQTTSVESQRIVQLVGKSDDADLEQRARNLYKLLFYGDESLDKSRFCQKQIEVSIESASNLPNKDFLGSVDPFCQVACGGIVHETSVRKRESNPVWKQNFLFRVSNEETELIIKVMDWDRFKSNEIVGVLTISSHDLKSILNDSSSAWHHKSLPLTHEGEAVVDANGSTSKVEFRLRNAGLVVSGCELSELKRFCLAFDTNSDGEVSEEEFISMMKQISGTTTLFTGSESGDSLLESLSLEQVQALLKHKWIIPGNQTMDPLENIIKNIHNQAALQSQGKVMANDKTTDPTGDTTMVQRPLITGGWKNEEQSETRRDSDKEITTSISDAAYKDNDDDSKPMEAYIQELKLLATTLRRHKVIVLPSLSWGSENDKDSNHGSLEEIAIRSTFSNWIFRTCMFLRNFELQARGLCFYGIFCGILVRVCTFACFTMLKR